MSHTLAPHSIRTTREAFGLSSAQFAGALGVHPTTVSRWETSRIPAVAVEGTAWTILSSVSRRIEQDAHARSLAHAQGQRIAEALLIAGSVVALALLVDFAAERLRG